VAELKYKSLYEDQEFEIYLITFVHFNVCIIYRIKTLEHSTVPFSLILESSNAI